MNGNRMIPVLAVLNLLAFLATITVNGLANALPINGVTTGQLSDLYPNLFVPAGFTFAVWGVIYLLLGAFTFYQLLPTARKTVEEAYFIRRIGHFFIITCLSNTGWIFAWHYQMLAVSLGLMLVLLGGLLAIYLRLGIGKVEATSRERYLVHLPFSVYLGWITIATIANVTALLVDMNWGGFGLSDQFWAVAVIVVGIGIGLAVVFTRRDTFYGLVVEWAIVGILVKRLTVESEPIYSVIAVCIAGLVIIGGAIAFQVLRRTVY